MDKKLYTKIKNGDPKAFKKLYNQNADKSFSLAYSIIKDYSLASDATQEAFIKVYRSFQSYDPNKPFEPWLKKIIVNECYRLIKKNKSLHQNTELIEETAPDVSKEPLAEEDEIYIAVYSLKEILRTPIILMYYEGYSEKEIASLLETNVSTIKSRLYKARQQLKKKLGGMFNE